MAWALFDSSIYIGHWERGLYDDVLLSVRRSFVVRHSAVVLSELRRGARTKEVQEKVAMLFRLARTQWSPSERDWWEAGGLIRDIADREGWDPIKRRSFQNDALIALTARRYGATIVTANKYDFRLLSTEVGVPIIEA